MATTGFSVSSPDLVRLVTKMGSVNVSDIIRGAAFEAAGVLVTPLQQEARASGASNELVSQVKVFLNGDHMVMRHDSMLADVCVGVTGASPAADEADELEWGGIYGAPKAWVRRTAERNRGVVNAAYSASLTNKLDEVMR